ncbi:peptide chain release factor N(5)-glutamine methyltransferase [Pseudomonadales bacterium]|nr:peptide chain release factor N(5)-glutamine methyltransferase [Pseudomonadales bacterium]
MFDITLTQLLVQSTAALAAAGQASARLEAEVLIAFVFKKPRSYLYAYPEVVVSDMHCQQVNALIDGRVAGRPIAYLVQERDFWSLPLYVNEHVLIPRPETECMVEAVLQLSLPDDCVAVDLGSGSGAIVMALAVERPEWVCLASDRLAEPLQVVKKNIDDLHGAHTPDNGMPARLPMLLQAEWLSACAEACFDLVISNPPYIEDADPYLDRGDLRFEPRSALASGADGLGDIRCIAKQARRSLKLGGYLALEHGYAQQQQVVGIVEGAGFEVKELGRDLAGLPRYVVAQSHS